MELKVEKYRIGYYYEILNNDHLVFSSLCLNYSTIFRTYSKIVNNPNKIYKIWIRPLGWCRINRNILRLEKYYNVVGQRAVWSFKTRNVSSSTYLFDTFYINKRVMFCNVENVEDTYIVDRNGWNALLFYYFRKVKIEPIDDSLVLDYSSHNDENLIIARVDMNKNEPIPILRIDDRFIAYSNGCIVKLPKY